MQKKIFSMAELALIRRFCHWEICSGYKKEAIEPCSRNL
jgi:hypothetical protein